MTLNIKYSVHICRKRRKKSQLALRKDPPTCRRIRSDWPSRFCLGGMGPREEPGILLLAGRKHVGQLLSPRCVYETKRHKKAGTGGAGGGGRRDERGVEGREGGSYGCIQKASVTAARAARDERESSDKEDNRGESKVRAPVRLRRGRGRKKKKRRRRRRRRRRHSCFCSCTPSEIEPANLQNKGA